MGALRNPREPFPIRQPEACSPQDDSPWPGGLTRAGGPLTYEDPGEILVSLSLVTIYDRMAVRFLDTAMSL
jgi:hypothetical protein